MDYVEIIENYVKQAWEQGEATADIKAQLIAKRWPEEMVTAVIDRLVKHRVETDEGKLPVINGPDFWSQPTWPTDSSGWNAPPAPQQQTVKNEKSSPLSQISLPQKPHKRRFSALIAANSHAHQPSTLPAASLTTNSQPTSTIANNQLPNTNQAQPTDSSTSIQADPPAQNPTPTTINSPQVNPQLHTDNVLPTALSANNLQTQTDEPPLAISPNSPKTKAEIITSLQTRDHQQKKLPQKLQENRIARFEDEKIQVRSLIFLACLFFVLVLALLWRFFVVQ